MRNLSIFRGRTVCSRDCPRREVSSVRLLGPARSAGIDAAEPLWQRLCPADSSAAAPLQTAARLQAEGPVSRRCLRAPDSASSHLFHTEPSAQRAPVAAAAALRARRRRLAADGRGTSVSLEALTPLLYELRIIDKVIGAIGKVVGAIDKVIGGIDKG